MFERASDFIHVAEEFFQNHIRSSAEEANSKGPQRSLPKILVVDDERRIADTLSEILEMSGFHVIVAYDGWEALEQTVRFHPDYLLSDVLMPRMNGVELAIVIRKIYPATKILLFQGRREFQTYCWTVRSKALI